MLNLPIILHITKEWKPEIGKFSAHCLEFDLVVSAPTEEQLQKRLASVLKAHLDFAHEHNLDPLKKAPEHFWEKLKDGNYRIIRIIRIIEDQTKDKVLWTEDHCQAQLVG